MRNRLSISEIFGPVVQGEGPTQGRSAIFVRLGLCNLDCSWCDTPYTWDWTGKNGTVYDRAEELTSIDIEEIAEQILDLSQSGRVERVVITGGEPLIQQRRLLPLIADLTDRGFVIEIETNGTISPHPDLLLAGVRFNVSPKLPGSGVDSNRAIIPPAIDALQAAQSEFKFVVADAGDLAEVEALVERFGISPGRVWIMPEGTTHDRIISQLPHLFGWAAVRGFNLSARLHVLAFDDRRGV